MKKAHFLSYSESVKAKKELENLMKGSKEEYRNASSREKKSLQQIMGLQSKPTNANIVMKGREVLDVSGRQRRGSSGKSGNKSIISRASVLSPILSDGNEDWNEVYSKNESHNLDVLMKGQAVLKTNHNKGKETIRGKDKFQDYQEVPDPFSNFMETADPLDATKPAIVASSNTTKSMSLGSRKPKPKRYEPPKRFKPKKKADLSQGKRTDDDDNGSKFSRDEPVFTGVSAINISIEKNLTFDDLDEEFYEIMRRKLKVNINAVKALADVPEDGESLNSKDRMLGEAEEFEDGVSTMNLEEGDPGHRMDEVVLEVIQRKQDGVNNEGNVHQNDEVVVMEENVVLQGKEDAEDVNDITDIASKDASLEKAVVSENDKVFNEEKYQSASSLTVPMQPSTDSNITAAPIFFSFSEDQIELNSAESNGNIFDKDEALKALSLPMDVLNEDVIHVTGEKASASKRPTMLPANNATFVSKDALHHIAKQRKKSFLTSWNKPKSIKQTSTSVMRPSSIHHFCTSIPAIQLPGHLKCISRYQHAPDKFNFFKNSSHKETEPESDSDLSLIHPPAESSEDLEPRILAMIEEKEKPSDDEIRLTDLAGRILQDALIEQDSGSKINKTLMKLQSIVDQLFDESDDSALHIEGQKIEIKNDITRFCWTPAPPKFDLPPDAVKQQLIPKYHGINDATDEVLEIDEERNADGSQESSSDDEESQKAVNFRRRILRRAHGSAPIELTRERIDAKGEVREEKKIGIIGSDDDFEQESLSDQAALKMHQIIVKLRENKSKNAEERGQGQDEIAASSDYAEYLPKRRTLSQPALPISDSSFQNFDSDYEVAVKELESQQRKLSEMKDALMEQKNETQEKITEDIKRLSLSTETTAKEADKMDDILTESNISNELIVERIKLRSGGTSRSETKSSLTSKRLSNKLIRRPTKGRLPRTRSPDSKERKRQIKKFLKQPARKIKRSVSQENIPTKAKEVPDRRLTRRNSLSAELDFEKEIGYKFDKEIGDLYFWTKEEYWYKWFEEVYPPSVQSEEEQLPEVQLESELNFDEDILQEIDVIDPPVGSEIYQLLLNEIDSMTLLIDSTESIETLAIHLCRRGACFRKIGDLKRAKEDLERSIQLLPKLVDAHWHRHLLHLLQGNPKKALGDLDYILNRNTKHFGAYRARAELYKKKGDLTSAIFNYSEAIKLRPEKADVYYERAYMFEQRGDILLALEDFKMATTLQPDRTEGIKKIGAYHFENKSWTAAINDFTALLAQEPFNEEAYTFRARAFAKLSQYQTALQDISTAIHLNPCSSLAFYYRGCLLRKSSQQHALQDLSTSLLLDNSASNVNACLHRGILYTEMKCWEEALSDFKAALKLDPKIPAAHVNLGLIELMRINNPHMAIRCFNRAIQVDPTYVRAHICRAEANQKLHSMKEAILDYTRAIHLRPDVTEYRMTRGKLLMHCGKFDLASYHIKQCAAMGAGSGVSNTQQAAVLSFLNNYEQAIKILEKGVKTTISPQIHILLGKTKAKAKMLTEAIESFGNALRLMKPWDETMTWPLAAADVYYLIGMAYTELVNHSSALEAFSNALKINPEFSQAYYQRGLTKMRLRYAKAVHDFNRALAYDPKFFQAYLSRAEYYGMKGRYSKAVLNCNEAIRLKPNSTRSYLYRGALKYYLHAYKLAIKDLTEAIAIDPNCDLAYFNRAVCYQEIKHYQRALKDYGIVLMLEKKNNIKVLQNRGLLYLETGELDNALRDFSAASKLEPRNKKLHHTLGICYHRLGLIETAVSCFSNSLKIDTFFIDALLGKGNAIMDYGTPESNKTARKDFLRALHLNPACLAARVNLAYSLQVQGRFKAAWIQFTKCIDIDPNFKSAFEGRAIINLQMGNTFGAFVDINAALRIESTAEFLTNRGVINQFMGDTVNAIRDYQHALKTDPSYSLAYYNAANVYFSHRQFKQALEYYDRAIGWNTNDESAYLNRGITRVLLKNFDGALEDFNRAADLSPFDAHIYFNRGNLNASLKRYENAETDYTKALSLQPGDALVYKRRADIRSKLSLNEKALSDYKRAIYIQTERITVP